MTPAVPLARDRAPLLSAAAWGVPLLLIAAAWLPSGDPMPLPVQLLFTALGAGVVALFWGLPRRLGYALTEGGLEVRRFSGTFLWPYAELRAQRTGGALGLKHFGTGVSGYHSGLYGWAGPEADTVQALASRTWGGVLIEYRGKRYFLTPADPEGFLAALSGRGVPVA